MKEPIRVLHVIGIMNRGGAETMIMNLYRQIDRGKIQFDFVEHTNERAIFDDEIERLGGRIYRCPQFTGGNYLAYRKWWKSFFDNEGAEYAIVHGHIGSTAAIYLKEAKKRGKYTIAHSHSSGTDHSLGNMVFRMLSYNTRNIADYFLGCSKIAGTDRYGKKIVESSGRFKVLPNAIDVDKYVYSPERRQRIRDELGYDQKQLLIGHVGRMTAEKNHTFILKIFKCISLTRSEARLILVGDGKLREELEKQVKKIGLSDKVSFLGVRSDVNDLMQAMDIFVFPSVYEGLPVTMVEAQAAGLPCVISDKVPMESIITKGLVTIRKLSDPPEEWANHILSKETLPRADRSKEIKENGFDIKNTANWIEKFYCARACR